MEGEEGGQDRRDAPHPGQAFGACSGDNGSFTKKGNLGFKGRPSYFGGGTTDQTHNGLSVPFP